VLGEERTFGVLGGPIGGYRNPTMVDEREWSIGKTTGKKRAGPQIGTRPLEELGISTSSGAARPEADGSSNCRLLPGRKTKARAGGGRGPVSCSMLNP